MSHPTVVRREVDISSPAGLHARPAADFATAAGRFAADIRLHKHGQDVDAKSVLLLLTLDVRQGDRVVVTADGPDAAEAISTLTALLDPDAVVSSA